MRTYFLAQLLMISLTSLWLTGCAQNPANSANNLPYDQQPVGRETGDVESARVHTELGAEYFRLKRYDVALEEFNTATERSSNYALAYNGLGLVYAALGDKSRAEPAFQRALKC